MNKKIIRILVVDDQRSEVILLSKMLGEIDTVRYQLDWEADPNTARERMRRDEHDLVLVDFRLGSHSGLELVREVRNSGVLKPIIVLTGYGAHQVDRVATEVGASDYLEKGAFDARSLERSIRYAINNSKVISELAAAHAALKEREAMLRLALNTALMGEMHHDLHTNVVTRSAFIDQLFGFQPGEARDISDFFSRIHVDDRAPVAARRHDAINGGGPWHHQYRVVWPDGTVRWVASHGDVIRDANGLPKATNGILMDITDRKQTEAVKEAALAEKEKLLNQKDLLLAEMNHRVANSLNLVSSLLTLTSMEIKDPGARKLFDEANRRVMAVALVHRHLYKSDKGERIEFSSYLSELCHDVLNSGAIDRQRLRLQVEADPVDLPVTEVIPMALITNELLINAMKYAFPDNRSGAIEVTFTNAGAEGHRRLMVADDGVGLPENFDPVSRKSLGMRIVRALAMQLGGRVDLIPGDSGTRFAVIIPAERPKSAHPH